MEPNMKAPFELRNLQTEAEIKKPHRDDKYPDRMEETFQQELFFRARGF